MQISQSRPPYGRRLFSLSLMETQIVVQHCSTGTIAHKWCVLDAIRKAKNAIGITDRTISVLNALLSFLQETTLQGGEAIIVFPSNKSLAQRSNGMAEISLRRPLVTLVSFVLIIRRDSPNGKRYARRGQGGEIEEAFEFDLSPLAACAEMVSHSREPEALSQFASLCDFSNRAKA
jgi:replication initiation protein RepC